MTDLRDVAHEEVRKARQRKLKLVTPPLAQDEDDNRQEERLSPSDPAEPAAFPGTSDESDIASGATPSNAKLALEGYQRAVRQAGLGPDDPLLPLLQAMGEVAMAVGEAADAMPGKLDAVIERADAAARAQLVAARAAGEADREAVLREVVDSLAPRVSEAVARAARRFDRMLAVTVAGGLVIGLLVAAVGGYAYGRSEMDGEARATEASLSAAFSGGVTAASEWARLVRANAGAAPISVLCKDGAAQHGMARDGRRWCSVPLWLDVAKPEAPR